MFGTRFDLFQVAGFQLRADISWFPIVLLFTWSLQGYFREQLSPDYADWLYWVLGFVTAIGLFVSIILHELGHSVVARRHGVPIQGITLFIFGGVAELSGEPKSPRSEFLIAIGGPLVSLVLAIFFLGAYQVTQRIQSPDFLVGCLQVLGRVNLAVLVFNLIPAYPLDGGRVLRSILWSYKDRLEWATRVVSKIGAGFGMFLIIFGVLGIISGEFGMLWFAILGLFLRTAAQMSYRQLMFRQALEGETVRHFMNPEPISVSPTTSLEQLIENYVYVHHHKMFPVVDNDKLIGSISIDQIKSVSSDERSHRTVSEFLRPCSDENTIDVNTDAAKALSIMTQSDNSRLMVTENEELVGIVSLKDLQKFLSLKMEFQED